MDQNTLPSLPSSSEKALQNNYFDGFYQIGARDFWQGANVSAHEVRPFADCSHYVIQHKNEATCAKCHVGWILPANWQVVDGKLFDGETQLQFAH